MRAPRPITDLPDEVKKPADVAGPRSRRRRGRS
jgi:hypothetical protein